MKGIQYLSKSWISLKIEQRRSPLHGLGLFAVRAISPGEIVVVWGCNLMREKDAQAAKRAGQKTQRIDEDLWDVFDPATKNEDPSYNHNHSCDPNTWMEDTIIVSARRHIKPGEELTIDYATISLEEDWVMSCQCGSPQCRQKITGQDWRKKDLQKKYAGHFLPYLNRKIKALSD